MGRYLVAGAAAGAVGRRGLAAGAAAFRRTGAAGGRLSAAAISGVRIVDVAPEPRDKILFLVSFSPGPRPAKKESVSSWFHGRVPTS
ncbi:MAG: hypothetical protein AMXMBFR25_05110 [Lysobacterales bacterium]